MPRPPDEDDPASMEDRFQAILRDAPPEVALWLCLEVLDLRVHATLEGLY